MKIFAFLVLITFSFGLLADHDNSLDGDSCWDGRTHNNSSCLVVEKSWWDKNTKDKLYVRYKNICAHRIYVKLCNDRINGSPDCGSSGIAGYSGKTHYTYNASGPYRYNWVGVDQPSKDWVCAGKVSSWHDT